MSVGFGLVGSGFMAHTYAQSLAKHVPDGHLVAVAEGTRAPALAAEYGVDRSPDMAALLARDDVDAVLICTPHSTHLPLTEAAAAAGKHVYIEKPMAVTLADCDAMIAACRDARVLLDVNHVTRHRASPVAAKGLIDDGSIGELRIVRVLSLGDRLPHRRPRLGAQGRRRRRVAGHGRPPVRCPALVHGLGGRGHLREGPRFRRRPEPAPERPGRGGHAQWRHRPGADQLRGARRPASARRASGRSSAPTGSSSPIHTARSGLGGATAGRTSSRCRRSRSTPTSTARSG